ncbi:MAG: hypothetical protein KGS45_12400 [Planctomycetes bacterium]|nr:hypothetical protein [Planctomycetota bacterium]
MSQLKFAKTLTVASLLTFSLTSATLAQSTISPAQKFSWSENVGWMNWGDAGTPAGSSGVIVNNTFLSGFVWSENIGWINMGDGTPADGMAYANVTGLDFGVNVLADGTLTGMAWSENTGWINFNTAAALGAQKARLDRTSGRFRGYAWGENIGWVNMDNADKFVGIRCPADFNQDGVVDFFDYLDFVAAFSSGC